jgi:hypothetical protein
MSAKSLQPYSTAAFSNKTASGFMDEGIKKHIDFKRLWVSSKEAAIDAGYYFYRARNEVGDGNFSEFLLCYEKKIARTTVYRYVEFVGEVLAWAANDSPQLIGKTEALIKRGKELVMQSPKGYIALCRQLEVMRKFGEYDEVKYAKKKLAGTSQIEFDFLDVCEALDVITQLGKSDVVWKLPEGKQTPEALRELKTKLDTASKQVDEQLKNAEAITT